MSHTFLSLGQKKPVSVYFLASGAIQASDLQSLPIPQHGFTPLVSATLKFLRYSVILFYTGEKKKPLLQYASWFQEVSYSKLVVL